jgi:hypothetical protein
VTKRLNPAAFNGSIGQNLSRFAQFLHSGGGSTGTAVGSVEVAAVVAGRVLTERVKSVIKMQMER